MRCTNHPNGKQKEGSAVEKWCGLPNIGPKLAAELQRAGIDSPEALRALGAREAFLRLRAQDPTACLHRLYALEGAIEGVRKPDLAPQTKQELKDFFRGLP